MSVTLTYDSTLARVRITAEVGVLARWTFATGIENWQANPSGLVQRVATPSEDGNGSLQYTPPGVIVTVGTVLGGPLLNMVNPAVAHTLSMRVRSSAGHADVVAAVDWYNAAGANIATGGLGAPVNVPAATWTTVTSAPLTPPAGAVAMRPRMRLGTTPAPTNLFHQDSTVVTYPLPGAVAAVRLERSLDGVTWQVVRGARELTVSSNLATIDDYEFAPGVVNRYRATYLSDVGVSLGTETSTVTPVIDRVWLKSVTRPFLNTPVTVQDYTAVTRRSRAGLFEIPGRSFPVRVGDLSSSSSWSMTLLTRTLTEARALDFLISSGDTVYVQVPPGFDIPGGYVGLGDMSKGRLSRTLADDRRLFTLPMTEVAAPAETVVGYAATWAGVLADFGSWSAVLAAFPTWAALQQYVADPQTVVVP